MIKPNGEHIISASFRQRGKSSYFVFLCDYVNEKKYLKQKFDNVDTNRSVKACGMILIKRKEHLNLMIMTISKEQLNLVV